MTAPTIVEIRDQILADIQAGLGLSEPLAPRSTWGIVATAIAGALSLVYRFGAWVRRQIFTQTADIEALILRAGEYGLARTAATEWRGTVTATGTDGTSIPAGTLFQSDGVVYQSTATTAISGSTATVSLRSLDTGSDVNLVSGDTLDLVTPIAGIDRSVTWSATTRTAADAESVEAFRARVLNRQRNTPQGGAIPDWIGWATAVAGIGEAKIDRPDAGSITIYPLTDDSDPANRIPSASQLTEVETYVTDPERSPIRAAAVSVVAPTEINFDVDIADLSPNTATVRDAIEAAIETHLYGRRPKQYSDEPDPTDVVSAAQITRVAIEAGADVATVTLKNAGGSSITDYTLEIDELAVLRTLTWV